jgi:Sulfotransferase family
MRETASFQSGRSLFFGVGAGRCGTMALANILSSETDVTCLHEAKFRSREIAGEKLLPYLTLQNGRAYRFPEQSAELFARFRSGMAETAHARGDRLFGDIAYYYAPFLKHVPALFPDARIIVIFRNGVDFVQSATTLSGHDDIPIGWPPKAKPLNDVERFVGLGRWQPRHGDQWFQAWENEFDHFERNAWLWAETNRAILVAIKDISPERLLVLRYETFFYPLAKSYPVLRAFLGIEGRTPDATLKLLAAPPINHRSAKAIGDASTWTNAMKTRFREIAGDVMSDLGYSMT